MIILAIKGLDVSQKWHPSLGPSTVAGSSKPKGSLDVTPRYMCIYPHITTTRYIPV